MNPHFTSSCCWPHLHTHDIVPERNKIDCRLSCETCPSFLLLLSFFYASFRSRSTTSVREHIKACRVSRSQHLKEGKREKKVQVESFNVSTCPAVCSASSISVWTNFLWNSHDVIFRVMLARVCCPIFYYFVSLWNVTYKKIKVSLLPSSIHRGKNHPHIYQYQSERRDVRWPATTTCGAAAKGRSEVGRQMCARNLLLNEMLLNSLKAFRIWIFITFWTSHLSLSLTRYGK